MNGNAISAIAKRKGEIKVKGFKKFINDVYGGGRT